MPRLTTLAAAAGGALAAAVVTAFFMSGTVTIDAEAAPEFDDAFKEKVRAVLVKHPEIIIEAMENYQKHESERESAELQSGVNANLAKIATTPGVQTIGKADAKVHMVEFFDYHCGFCKAAMPSVLDMLKTNPDLKISFVEYPIFGAESDRAAAAALAAAKQGKYLEMHRALMAAKGSFDDERIKRIARDLGLDTVQLLRDMDSQETQKMLDMHDALGVAIGIQGTPAFIINGTAVGGWDEAQIRDLISKGLQGKK